MEDLLIALMERIASQMIDVVSIDEDWGQLSTDEDTYPIAYPCVLITAPSVTWSNLSRGDQRGEVAIDVTLAVDCYDDTHYSSGTYDKLKGRMETVRKLNNCVHTYRPGSCSALIRERTVSQYLGRGIKAYRMSYSCSVTEDHQTESIA